ncbi:hypothetical protein TWF102_003833 [Orbilia oligospora]|uniref:Uncharacterized protein n=1 Tax=Orbilia oligospora TaxID=2813651 RepID=A0A7C8J969_ORBOL|nr:hypothetical protein TWF102_003833 [Orbilia oligospora]KAF3096962.1 hypothetical protein TWF103_009728 [Orbilia oligospora]
MLKCIFCRRDKKKCSPKDRKLPKRCDWCIKSCYPCSERYSPDEMRQSVSLGYGSKNAVKRVVIRPSIEIVQDLDCLLYLQSGLQECEALPPYDTVYPDSRPPSQSNRIMAYNTSMITQDTFVNGYIYPSSKEILLQNLDRLPEIKLACMGRVYEALKAVQHEADIAIEHLSAKGRVCEANVLTSMLVESPESYGTMAVYERNKQFEASQRLEAMRLSQKQCGRLFLVIKSSTLPLCLNPCPVECISINDIQSAEGYLERLVERLKLLPLGPHGIWSTTKSIRHGTEYSLSSKERGLNKHPFPKGSRNQLRQHNLLGETGVHFALKNDLQLATDLICSELSEKQPKYGDLDSTDIRGMNFSTVAILSKSFNALHSKLPSWKIENRKCFLTGKEIFGQKSNYFNPESISQLDVHQIAAAIGEIESVHTLANICPVVYPYNHNPWSDLYEISNTGNITANDASLDQKVDIGSFPPISLAAICQNFHLIPQTPNYSVSSFADIRDEALFGLLILAFKSNQEGVLSQLSLPIRRLGLRNILDLTKVAIGTTTLTMFKKWFEVAWNIKVRLYQLNHWLFAL